jgi:hypothetical protein
MPDPETTIEKIMIDQCDICKELGKFELRMTQLEENYTELKGIIREHKTLVFQKFDSQNKYIIATLTTALISALLLTANLIKLYGGR